MKRTAPSVLALVLLLGYASPAAHSRGSDADGRLAYCHATERKQPLIDAAAALDLVRDAGDHFVDAHDKKGIPLEEWEMTYPSDYKRACDALISAAQMVSAASPPQRTPAVLPILLPVVAGAILALASAEWRVSRDRRHQLARTLRVAAGNFRRDGSSLLRAWSTALSKPDPGPFFTQRDNLISELNSLGVSRAAQNFAAALVADLVGLKPERLAEAWPTDHTAREDRRGSVEAWLTAVEHDVGQLANRLERFSTRPMPPPKSPTTPIN